MHAFTYRHFPVVFQKLKLSVKFRAVGSFYFQLLKYIGLDVYVVGQCEKRWTLSCGIKNYERCQKYKTVFGLEWLLWKMSAFHNNQMNLFLLNGLWNLQQIKLVVCWNIRQCPTFRRKKIISFSIKHSSLSGITGILIVSCVFLMKTKKNLQKL